MMRRKFAVETRWGGSEDSPTRERLRELVAELDVRDEEHPDTWMTDDSSGWSLRLDEDGFAYLSDLGSGESAYLADVTRERALDLWLRFANTGREGVLREPWIDGRPPVSHEEVAARDVRMQQSMLAGDRAFYDQLGAERPAVMCRAPSCGRGAIELSVFCRTHHFEQVWKRTCPFTD